MPSKVDELEAQALSLSTVDRARLAHTLLESLDEATNAELETAWAEEAERRYRETLDDPSVVEPASAAFQRARDALGEDR